MAAEELLKRTAAYRTALRDAESGRQAHAYLLLYADHDNLRPAARLFAKALLGAEEGGRAARLIDRDRYPDCVVAPPEGRSLTAEDADGIVADSIVRPVEGDRKLYVVLFGDKMNPQAQNKLLKTLEEPPASATFLLAAAGEEALLSTVRSRTRRLEIPAFGAGEIAAALAAECADADRLALAAEESGGAPGRALALYRDERLVRLADLAADVLTNMRSSAEVSGFAARIRAEEEAFGAFLSVMKLLLRDAAAKRQGGPLVLETRREEVTRIAETFSTGAILDAIDKIGQVEYGAAFNANAAMQTDNLLFGILEGKYRWRK